MELGITQSTNIYNTRSLICTLKYVLDILQTEEAFMLEEYKHTHTHTHTRTHTHTHTHNHLVRKRTLNHFAKLVFWVLWLTCILSTYLYGIHLNFRYRTCSEEAVLWHSGNYIVHIYSEMLTSHDNKIQDIHFPEAIKIVAKKIHYCYCLIHYCYCFESVEQLYGIGW